MPRTLAGPRQLIQGLYFNSGTNRVTLTNIAALNNLSAVTVEAFITLNSKPTFQARIFDHSQVANKGYSLAILSNSLSIAGSVCNNTTTTSINGGTVPIGIRCHVAVTWDGSNVRIYLNGNQVGSTTALSGGNTNDDAQVPVIGNRAGTDRAFNGIIHSLRISNTARYTGSTYTIPSSLMLADANTVGLYNLREGTGTIATDSSSQGNNGTLTGSPLPVWNSRTAAGNRFLGVGASQQSLSFNGTSDLATVPVTPSTSGFSMGFWMYIPQIFTGANQNFISWQDGATSNGFRIFNPSGLNTVAMQTYTASTQGDVNTPVQLGWHFFVFTWLSNSLKLYYDGVLIVEDTTASMNASSTTLTLGKRSDSANFAKCKIKNLTFQNTATPWTQQQITDLMYRNIIPSVAQQWSMNGTLNDTTGSNALTATGTSYSNDVPSQFIARTFTI